MFFDSHTHFNNEGYSEEERAALLEATDKATKEGKLSYAADIGFDVASSQLAVYHARKYPWCYAAVGCHPHDASKMDQDKLECIRQLALEERTVAIGEIGLDFHYDYSPRQVQEEWFRRQIRLANELGMPIVIHSREADGLVMDILKEEGAFSEERKAKFPKRPDREGFAGGTDGLTDDARVLLHCFSGSAELGRQYVKLGATISVAGPVTYKNNKKTVAVVEEIPLDFLLVETDAPYLAPVPFRGKRNTPLLVRHTAAKVAEIKGVSIEDVAAITCENALRFYGIK